MPKAILFDLDDTLAESFQPPTRDMIRRLSTLLDKTSIAILTAAGFPRIETEFLDHLALSPHIDRCYVFPNSASQCYTHRDGAWRVEYSLDLSPDERAAIKQAIDESIAETGAIEEHPKYEPRVIDRESEVALAALGLEASADDKKNWDPDKSKRIRLADAIKARVPDFQILVGGNTTIDITRKGIDKAYGVRWLAEKLGCQSSEMLFVGDALYAGGNDAVVIPTGVQTHAVASPEETATFIDELIRRYEGEV